MPGWAVTLTAPTLVYGDLRHPIEGEIAVGPEERDKLVQGAKLVGEPRWIDAATFAESWRERSGRLE